jgi:hypothetical protein
MAGREVLAGFRFREAGPADAAALLALKRSPDRETSFMLMEPDELFPAHGPDPTPG